MPHRPPTNFTCPHCRARYKVVRAKAGADTVRRGLLCTVCHQPLTSTEGDDLVFEILPCKSKGTRLVIGSERLGLWPGPISRSATSKANSTCCALSVHAASARA